MSLEEALMTISRNLITGVCTIALIVVSGCATKSTGARIGSDTETLLQRLREVPVNGPTFNGRWRAVRPTKVTKAIVAKGPEVVPALIAELDRSTLDETIYIVMILRELRAVEAQQRIVQLTHEIETGRFPRADRDMTLEVQIEMYLEAIGNRANRGVLPVGI